MNRFLEKIWVGSYHSKNVLLGLEKFLFGPIFRREEVFRGLKQHFLSDKTQFFFKKSVLKGETITVNFFFKSEHYTVSVFK